MQHLDSNQAVSRLRRQNQPGCFGCGLANSRGFGLKFSVVHDGAVEAAFPCQPSFAGDPGMPHGEVICTLLDGAMTNCLFAHGLAAVTVDMHVRFRHPVKVSLPAVVRDWLESEGPQVHRIAAELLPDGQIMAMATARFVVTVHGWKHAENAVFSRVV